MDVNGLWIAQAVGVATGLGFEAFKQYKTGKLHIGKLLVATATGAIGGIGSSAIKNIAAGTVANTANSIYQQSQNKCDNFKASKVISSSVQGAAGVIMGRGFGDIGRNIRKSNVVGGPVRGNNDYSNIGTAVGSVAGGSFANQ